MERKGMYFLQTVIRSQLWFAHQNALLRVFFFLLTALFCYVYLFYVTPCQETCLQQVRLRGKPLKGGRKGAGVSVEREFFRVFHTVTYTDTHNSLTSLAPL